MYQKCFPGEKHDKGTTRAILAKQNSRYQDVVSTSRANLFQEKRVLKPLQAGPFL